MHRYLSFAQVLFCKLTEAQLELYRAYLASEEVRETLSKHISELRYVAPLGSVDATVLIGPSSPSCPLAFCCAQVSSILAGNRNALAGIDMLRKVCNHPDLLERTSSEAMEDYGNKQYNVQV